MPVALPLAVAALLAEHLALQERAEARAEVFVYVLEQGAPHALGPYLASALGRVRGATSNRSADEACRQPHNPRRRNGANGAGRLRQPSGSAPPVGGTSEHQSLSKYIQARFDECSRSQKDVAQYIVDHLDEAAFQTAEELARRANTSSSTVVRFSQALGFEGFPELQARRARGIPPRARQGRQERRRRQLHAAVLARPERVRDGAHGRSPERRGDRAQGLPQLGRGADRGDRRAPRRCSSRAPTRWRSSPATCATC